MTLTLCRMLSPEADQTVSAGKSGSAEAASSTEYLSNYQTGTKLSHHHLALCLPKTKRFLPLPWTPLLLMPVWLRAKGCAWEDALDVNNYWFPRCPGEALLSWACWWEGARDCSTLQRFLRQLSLGLQPQGCSGPRSVTDLSQCWDLPASWGRLREL